MPNSKTDAEFSDSIEIRKKITKPYTIKVINHLSELWCVTPSEAAYRIITEYVANLKKEESK